MAKNKKKSKKLNTIISNILLVFFALVFIGCSIYLGNYYWQSHKSENLVDDLKSYISDFDDDYEATDDADYEEDGDSSSASEGEPSSKKKLIMTEVNGVMVQKKFAKLYGLNSDFVGWLSIKGTNIDYPVMQSLYEEEYYIHRDFEKGYSSAGTLFIDTASDIEKPSDNILIYGHNMKTGKMFHDLLYYENEDFYKEHKTFRYNTIYDNGEYEVIAAFRTVIHDDSYTGFCYDNFFDAKDAKEFDDYVSNCQKLTIYKPDSSASFGDQLLTLSTCAYHADNGRFVVVAKKIR